MTTGTATVATAMADTNSLKGAGQPVAQALIDIYGLKDGVNVLDVGCGKAFLLYEMKKTSTRLR